MPKKRRQENKGLPARWRLVHGAYYYRVPPGLEHLWDGKTEFKLGRSLPDAYKAWAARIDRPDNFRDMSAVLDRYMMEVVPTKAPATQKQNLTAIKRLRGVFGNLHPSKITPALARQYMANRKGGIIVVKHEMQVLRHVLTCARDWGVIERNELLGQIKLPATAARQREIKDWEIREIQTLPAATGGRDTRQQMIAYVNVKLLTGLRRYDMLRLLTPDRYPNGIEVTTSKTGKRLVIEMTDELVKAMLAAQEARPVNISPWLFCDSRGGCYMREDGTAPAFRTRWQRFLNQVMTETKIIERFKETDLRARTAHDAGSLADAQALLGHASPETTKRVYRRAAQRVKPTR